METFFVKYWIFWIIFVKFQRIHGRLVLFFIKFQRVHGTPKFYQSSARAVKVDDDLSPRTFHRFDDDVYGITAFHVASSLR